jgi:DNA (cytosine-5)-methyltransferase 1
MTGTKLRFGSVCSGIEAASVAWEPLGFRAAFVSEIEAFPCAVLAHHYPDVPNRGDMTRFAEWPTDAIDLLVGGTPCQSFSVAGLRAGLADPRGNLMLTYLAIAAKLRPRWLVWENVPGVLSSNGGRDFGTFLGGLGELGYGFAYRVLDAQFCRTFGFPFAVPQRRRRVFVVGHLGDWRRAAAVLFDGASLRGDPAPRREARQGVAPTISSRPTGGGGLGTDFDLDGGLVPYTRAGHGGYREGIGTLQAEGGDAGAGSETLVAGTLNAGAHPGSYNGQDAYNDLLIAHALRADGFDASEDGTGRGTPLVVDTLVSNGDAHSGFRDEKGLVALPINTQIATRHEALGEGTGFGIGDELDPAFTLQAGHSHAVAFTCSEQANGFAWERDVYPTLDAQVPNDTSNIQKGVRQGWAVRRLTPTECERLQGFPDGYTAISYRNKPAADGPRYKALGNSMAVNVMRVLGERIALVDAMQERAAA